MIELIRTQASDPDFMDLVSKLDKELAVMDGEDHDFYHQFNHLNDIHHVVVAYLFGTPVGCGAIKKYDGDKMEIKRMFVRLDRRGFGFAGQILKELEVWARELKFSYCILETGINQPAAIQLYKKSGYERIENYGQYQGVENSLCFQKLIKT